MSLLRVDEKATHNRAGWRARQLGGGLEADEGGRGAVGKDGLPGGVLDHDRLSEVGEDRLQALLHPPQIGEQTGVVDGKCRESSQLSNAPRRRREIPGAA